MLPRRSLVCSMREFPFKDGRRFLWCRLSRSSEVPHVDIAFPMVEAQPVRPGHGPSTRSPRRSFRRSMWRPPICATPTTPYSLRLVYGRAGQCDRARGRRRDRHAGRSAEAALLFSSGMAAATAVFQALAPGDHIVAPKVMYWALRNWLLTDATRWGLEGRLRRHDDLDAVRAAVRPGETKLVWIETPANPLWTITDIAGARRDRACAPAPPRASIRPCATPILTRPLTLGADIVMHAATKYLNGHSDVVAGALADAQRGRVLGSASAIRAQIGAILGPFEAWLLMRGMRTLHPARRAAAATARDLAQRFASHPHGRPRALSRPAGASGHDIAARQMQGGFGGMLSIRVTGGEAARDRAPRRGQAVEARDLARRRREPDRAPRLDRGPRHPVPARPAAPLRRHRGRGGSVSRSRRGVEGVTPSSSCPVLVAGTHVFAIIEDVDGRDKPGHDG